MTATDLVDVLIKLKGNDNSFVPSHFFVMVLLTLGGLVSALPNNYGSVIMTSKEGVTSITNCRIPSAAALSLKPFYGSLPTLIIVTRKPML